MRIQSNPVKVNMHFALMAGVFFLCALLFLALADFPVTGVNQNQAVQTAGVGWTGIIN